MAPSIENLNQDKTVSMSIDTIKPFDLPQGNGAKVCIGGGAGFIGSHIALRLKENGYKDDPHWIKQKRACGVSSS